MTCLVDTNILLRSSQPHHSLYSQTVHAVAALHRHGEFLVVAAQNIVEFWAVATRREKENGLGLSPLEARKEIERLESLFPLVPDHADVYKEWRRLVATHRVLGVNAHDARLAAIMNLYRIEKILTYDTADFKKFPHIKPVHPREV